MTETTPAAEFDSSETYPRSTKMSGLAIMGLLALLSATLLAGVGYLYYQNQQLVEQLTETSTPLPAKQTNDTVVPVADNSSVPVTQTSTVTWKREPTETFFEYPLGWHVAQLWPDTDFDTRGISWIINDKPISTAPRDGDFGDFIITVKNNSENPQAIFDQEIEQFKTNVTNLKEETLPSDVGQLVHLTGVGTEGMIEGQRMEMYVLLAKPTANSNVPGNQMIITANTELNASPEYSELLRHIVLSFKF